MGHNDKSLPIIIIGAGLGGLSLALALLRDGHKVRVYEQAAELKAVGAGLSLAPNSMKVFQALGIAEAIAAKSDTPCKGEIRHGITGELLSTTPFAALKEVFGFAYQQIHRADAHQVLSDAIRALDPGCMQLDHTFDHVEQTDSAVTVRFLKQPSVTGSCLIGCDGVRSSVRRQMTGEHPGRFTGFVVWRAIVPMHMLAQVYRKPQSNVRVLPQRQFVYYPIKSGTALNISAFAEQDWHIESWTEKADKMEFSDMFAAFSGDIQRLINAIDPAQFFKWALFDRDPLPGWQQGRVVLLGDAAHPVLPFLGQGAAMAIEDAWVLSRALASYSVVETAFQQYQQARRERTAWVLEESRAVGKRFGTENPSAATFSEDRAMHTRRMFAYDPITVCDHLFGATTLSQ